MDVELMLEEIQTLSKDKENNLKQIKEINTKIDECQENSRHYAAMIFINNHNLEMYRKKNIVLKKSMYHNLNVFITAVYDKLKIILLERENQNLEENRIHYKNKIISYEQEKQELEKENISISNKIFIIDDKINSNEKKLIKEAK